MAKIFMPELTPQERLRILESNYKSENMNYQKPLTPDEVETRQAGLSKNSIKLFEHNEDLKKIKEDFKKKMEPLVTENYVFIKELKTGHMEVNGEVFMVPDYDSNMMEFIDPAGEMVFSRRLLPEERQLRSPFLRPAANDQ